MPCLTTAAHLSHSDRDAGPHRSTNVPCLTTAARPLAGLPFAGLPERSTNVPCLTTAAHRGPAWRELGWVLPRSTNVPCLTTAAQAAIANIAHPVRVHRPLNECAVSDDSGTSASLTRGVVVECGTLNECAVSDDSGTCPLRLFSALRVRRALNECAVSYDSGTTVATESFALTWPRSTNVPCLTTAALDVLRPRGPTDRPIRSTNVPCLTTAAPPKSWPVFHIFICALNECAVSDDSGTSEAMKVYCEKARRSTNVPCLTTAALSMRRRGSRWARSTLNECAVSDDSGTAKEKTKVAYHPQAPRSTNVPCLTTAALFFRRDLRTCRDPALNECAVSDDSGTSSATRTSCSR